MAEEAILVDLEKSIILKKAIAKNLYSKRIDQLQISKILKLSQPMVSNYVKSDEKIPNKILELAEDITNKIINDQSVKFHMCISFSNNVTDGKFFIANKNEIVSNTKNQIIDNMTKAFLILKDKNLSKLIPKVKINIAMTSEIAEKSEDVAAFLNGLIIVDDKVTSYNGIHFGKSKHLSSLLLYLRKIIDVNAIMNIAYIKNPEETGFNYSYLSKKFQLEDSKKNIDILLHRGDFGIEPCAYILGKDAVDVSNKVLKIIKGLFNEK